MSGLSYLTFIETLGGLGLFLLGMIIMTDGLRALAGKAVRSALMSFTRSPFSGAMTGAVGTAILQSSSVTTVAAVGFVGAGLMTFPESLGIIFGANIGTTLKGWVIALLGFKFPLGTLVLPLILVGAILHLFAKGRLASTGYAIAGFGLIFVGITMMQSGMQGLEGIITPEQLPPDTWLGRIKLLSLGILATVLTQSSSAGVAATLTALFIGTINFHQAAALVIGMDVGTTVTAALATIGGSVESRRTGFSHVIYNLLTGIGALLLITPYTLLCEAIAPGWLVEDAELALVAFHSGFNTLGVIIALPFTHRFARFMQHLITEKPSLYTAKLDRTLLQAPSLALYAVQQTLMTQLFVMLRHVNAILGEPKGLQRTDLGKLQTALDDTQAYVDHIHLRSEDGADWQRLVAVIHVLDHMQRLHERCEEEEDRAITARDSVEFTEERDVMTIGITKIIDALEANRYTEAAHIGESVAKMIYEKVEPRREELMAKVASGSMDVRLATGRLEAIRWLHRVSQHIARITHHLAQAILHSGAEQGSISHAD